MTAIRRELGYLPQELGYPSDMTAFGFVEYVAVLKEWNDRRRRTREVRRVLDLVGLSDLAAKKVSKLSGGQKRRVGLAQALIGEPRILVLDEPTTGLDPVQRADLRRTLSVAGGRGAVLLSTHQTEDVAALCERVIVLADGGGPVRRRRRRPHRRRRGPGLARRRARCRLGRQLAHRQRAAPRRRRSTTPGAMPAEPTLEDAYLLMLGTDARAARAAPA